MITQTLITKGLFRIVMKVDSFATRDSCIEVMDLNVVL